MTALVWYAGYGSNLSPHRFACYVQGGTPTGGRRAHVGCRDRTPPRATAPLTFGGHLTFRGESTIWGGGMAFLDPHGAGEVVARGYLITEAQLDDVAAQETRYDGRADVAEHEGVPVVALTSSADRGPAAPSAPYLRTILAGLTDGLLETDDAIAYLLRAGGVDLLWSDATIRALLEQPAGHGG